MILSTYESSTLFRKYFRTKVRRYEGTLHVLYNVTLYSVSCRPRKIKCRRHLPQTGKTLERSTLPGASEKLRDQHYFPSGIEKTLSLFPPSRTMYFHNVRLVASLPISAPPTDIYSLASRSSVLFCIWTNRKSCFRPWCYVSLIVLFFSARWNFEKSQFCDDNVFLSGRGTCFFASCQKVYLLIYCPTFELTFVSISPASSHSRLEMRVHSSAAQLSTIVGAVPGPQFRTGARSVFSSKRCIYRRAVARTPTVVASDVDEVALLEKMLRIAKERKEKEAGAASTASLEDAIYDGKGFTIKTFNAISPVGLNKFPTGKYVVSGETGALPEAPMGIMLRSHKLQLEDVPPTVRGIVRCGAGTNNIPVKEMTERGIPVFNTPGANANAVKELVVCGLLLASRGVLEGNNHVNNIIVKEEDGDYEKISRRIEADKSMFGGQEIEGKTIGVIGLGAIGSR